MQQSSVRNRLLRALAPDAFALVAPHLVRLPMQMHQSLIDPGVPIRQLTFPESGFISITTTGAHSIELGLIGPEGAAGASAILLGSDSSPYPHFAQSPGEALAIDVDRLELLLQQIPAFRPLMLRFVHTLAVQTAQTAFVNAVYDIETRLARWLLMCQDRIGGDDLTLTHEFLGIMLGVQRTSVTLALQTLEGSGLIRARRGHIIVRDRDGLIAAAQEGYGLPEAEYARLIEGA